MRAHFNLGLLACSLLLVSAVVPAVAMSNAPIAGKGHATHKTYSRELDKLGPVTQQDTIEYDTMADI